MPEKHRPTAHISCGGFAILGLVKPQKASVTRGSIHLVFGACLRHIALTRHKKHLKYYTYSIIILPDDRCYVSYALTLCAISVLNLFLNNMLIQSYNNIKHRKQVIDLWSSIFGYKDARNNPQVSIDKKIDVNDGLFFVAIDDEKVIGTIMAGYDGHRGWIYSLAILPEKRNEGLGSKLLKHAENELLKLGCVKINLQILTDNEEIKNFYINNGFKVEERISMGKEIKKNLNF